MIHEQLMKLLGMEKEDLLPFVLSLFAIALAIWALIRTYSPTMQGYAPVYMTRPEVINFPGWENVTAAPGNRNVMPRQFTQAQKRFLHERRGPVYNFSDYGPGGDQANPRPQPSQKAWWGNT